MKSRAEDFEEWMTGVIFGTARGFLACLVRCLLRVVSVLFWVVAKARVRLYKEELIKGSHFGVPVISVGNVTMGGTGKTPVVELLAKCLQRQGRRVAVLSRGYKSHDLEQAQEWANDYGGVIPAVEMPKVVSDGKSVLLGPYHAGDEPYMLAQNLTGVAVLVDRHREKSARFALEHLGCDTLLLDDGMQYLDIHKELDIVLVDCNSPFGVGGLIPRGTRREPNSSLKRAGYIVLTKSQGRPQGELINKIRRINQVAEVIVSDHVPKYLQNVATGERLPLDAVRDKWIACLSGIARPESFENTVRDLGGKVEITRRFPDHHWFEPDDLIGFYERCADRAMDMIVTTEKDAVRLKVPADADVPVYFLRIEVEILGGHGAWDNMLERIAQFNAPMPPHEWSD